MADKIQAANDIRESTEYYYILNHAEETATGLYIKVDDAELNINYYLLDQDSRMPIYTDAQIWDRYEWSNISITEVLEYIELDDEARKILSSLMIQMKYLL